MNEWTLEMTPLRVMNVPKIDNMKLNAIKITFHFFNIPSLFLDHHRV